MKYLTFKEADSYPVCLLVPNIRKDDIYKAYIKDSNLSEDDLLVMDLHYTEGKKKVPMVEMRLYIQEELAPILEDMKVEYILCADADYFKALTKADKVEANLGYVMDSPFVGSKVIYIPNYKAIFYDPDKVKTKIETALNALNNHRTGSYLDPGKEVIKFEAYPNTDAEIEAWLQKLLDMNVPLTIDIEAFSLKHHTAGIATISFAWSQHEGIAFPVDYMPHSSISPNAAEWDGTYGSNIRNEPRREMLRNFFKKLNQTAIYHNIAFDVYALIYQLFMKDILDTKGLLEGLEIMLKDWDDTKLITYLATNSCSGNKLGLKDQAQEFSGNYAVDDIKDVTRIPLPELLRYNLVDSLSTWFVRDKHYQTMVDDNQLDIYNTLFKPTTVDIIQMQLTGMPLNMKRVKEVKVILQNNRDNAVDKIINTKVIESYRYRLNEQWVDKRNSKLKVKRVTLADANEKFNPNSNVQLQDLLFNVLNMPVISLTANKQPSTDGDTLKALRNHTQDPDILDFLNGMIDYAAVAIILANFIPAMEGAAQGPDGWHYMFGNFNLGGTLSGRLSSSKPNLQNIPASSYYAKLIKSCFMAATGWLFIGLDFSSLEDRISAVTTRDPNKLKVYTDGYDGHSLRAYTYFGDQMPDIENTVISINSIEKKYKPLRQESKAPTFALTYQGTHITLMKNCGFSQEKAIMIETKYHELYKVSDDWIADKLDKACNDGYITAAFGLRLRTPLLKQVIRGNSKTPYEAEAEGRTAGNALGQSWCLLNSRAGVEFNALVRNSSYKYDIRPCAQIHDAQYFLIRDDIEAIAFTNKHLVKAVQWQEHPDIANDEVKLGGELSIFYPNWNDEIVIKNGANSEEIFSIIDAAMLQRQSPKT